MSAVDVEERQPEQQPLQPISAYAGCLTPESKEKGDAGIYAAMNAMMLSRALRGATDSRLDPSQLRTAGVTAAGGGVAGARANGAAGSNSNCKTVQLGVEPEAFRHGVGAAVQSILSAAVVEAVQSAAGDADVSADDARAAVQCGMEGGLCGTSSTAVGLPEEVDAFTQVLPLVREMKPRDPVNFDALQRLFAVMEAAAAAADSGTGAGTDSAGVCALLLSKGIVDPAKQPPPSTAAWEAKYNELQVRYPLPTPPSTKDEDGNLGAGEEDEDEDEESEADRQHNAALQERCATLHLPYTTYTQALRDVASYEMRVFPLLCEYLSHNDACRVPAVVAAAGGVDGDAAAAAHAATRHRACANVKVLNLASNNLAAPAVPAGQEDGTPVRPLAPLRALAAMIDANETLRYLNLRDNALGPRGVGIVAKALTKNIALTGIDLSANALNGDGAADVEEVEDPLYEEEDPVFGETLEGLEALAEVLKKNKFMRVLRLAENGLHTGEDLTGPPPPEEEDEEEVVVEDEDEGGGAAGSARRLLSMAEAQERWQGAPLWNLLTPLHRYHRLRVLDLSKNLLGNTGAHMVAVAVAHNHSIEVLDLTDNAIGYSGLNHLARYLLAGSPLPPSSSYAAQQQRPQHGCALHTLILRQNPLACVGGASDAATGVDALQRRMSKKQQRQAAAAVANFAAGLQRHGRLRRLILAHTYLGPAASAAVLRALAHVPTLEELDFSFNGACGANTATFDPVAVPHIAALLYPSSARSPSHPAALQRLCLDGNNLTSAGLAGLLPVEVDTPVCHALRELTLSRNNLGDALEPLATLLASRLTRLDLSYNAISTMVALVSDFPFGTALEDLNLSHNKLGVQEGLLRDLPAARQEAEVSQLFRCLAQMPHLSVLDISYNDWRCMHIEQLGAIFADPNLATNLRKLDVRHTPRASAAPLMSLLRSVATRPTVEVFLASVPVKSGETAAAAATDDESAKAEEGEWTYDAVVEAIHAVVWGSATLVDVDCGLRPGDAEGRDTEAAQATEELIAQIRERLLLNALMAASTPTLQ
ncbi:hypothetical protein ABB37_07386 [Leptomonas pyrrhocoris]|uniref:Leucine-rich repeat protein n=1 Tax=Leptomonas pyrrhocoris TaxID=157538 RepID=A0A0M9FVX8_LEPPY|nr:hypothetical protein ABB37_07386 [Leptomonas pyrrhocoris]XP_015655486.1 hypothetical protein ABB37_07386 [Leptomonas pyrrhocoris]KPA77046.1 hypothetical protein ABB37_07386 [Leptomonas pyrrhocoris]KPA77047.1 hypothetical protein ABB37_07386 [Leptomonas pyrrhocoris]|eukprot:XP_015655485.1 hypothetical protein ABB37_07386 [Leptomonas pyrrhocoris]